MRTLKRVKLLLLIKNYFLIVAIVFSYCPKGFGQNHDEDEIGSIRPFREFGVYTNSTIITNDNTRIGVSGGAYFYFNLKLSEKTELQLGMELSMVRFYKNKVTTAHFQSFEDVKYSIGYFTIPLNFNLYLDKNRRFHLRGGVFFDAVISAKYSELKTFYNPSEGWLQENVTQSPQINRINGGVSGGVYCAIIDRHKLRINLGISFYYRPLDISREQTSMLVSVANFGSSITF